MKILGSRRKKAVLYLFFFSIKLMSHINSSLLLFCLLFCILCCWLQSFVITCWANRTSYCKISKIYRSFFLHFEFFFKEEEDRRIRKTKNQISLALILLINIFSLLLSVDNTNWMCSNVWEGLPKLMGVSWSLWARVLLSTHYHDIK